MSTAAEYRGEPRIQRVRVTADQIIARLADGRVIGVPLAWSWRLSDATPKQRANFRLVGAGQSIHWPDLDEDLSVEGMLHGTPARRPRGRGPGTGAGVVRDRRPARRRTRSTRRGRTRD